MTPCGSRPFLGPSSPAPTNPFPALDPWQRAQFEAGFHIGSLQAPLEYLTIEELQDLMAALNEAFTGALAEARRRVQTGTQEPSPRGLAGV